MREIILDTETTGLDPNEGHRLVEIGCVEMVDRVPTGATWHKYFNPERDMPQEAFAVHGLSEEFLKDKPLFASLAEEFVAFVGEARLVIHNAGFDMRFLNAELARVKKAPLPMDRVVDTLAMARRKHPGARVSLDELCQRYGIDNSKRVKHGALLDAEILAEVYIELTGGRQTALGLTAAVIGAAETALAANLLRARPAPLASRLTAGEIAAHEAFIAGLGGEVIWKRYLPEAS
ncbi:DNA polymerase III subunit epsilon [Labrys wisconsinensis]|uniref:DNA polymerase III subunit epsilon n=1 Tax=Labrys wisconsinensis TaxID=425677 RepID=A0ABU0J1D6_9HYPH|nr:DNA polymerase III subunit epsilon [Labrys wisconsinensis]MDQ0468067.1 DNA polymerase-3 subunit epsilon [Labrys wisconsinensis]